MAQNQDTEIYKAIERLRLAMILPDKRELELLTATELTYGHSAGKVETRQEFIEAVLSGQSNFESIKISDLKIQELDNIAIVRHLLDGDTKDAGKAPGTVHLSILQVWKKEETFWKLVARQAVKVQ